MEIFWSKENMKNYDYQMFIYLRLNSFILYMLSYPGHSGDLLLHPCPPGVTSSLFSEESQISKLWPLSQSLSRVGILKKHLIFEYPEIVFFTPEH